MKLAEHPLDQWVSSSPVFEQIWSTEGVLDECPGSELLSSVLPDPLTRLIEHLACKLLSSVLPDPLNWQGWLNTHPGCELLSSVWADLINWWGCPFSKWVASSVWADPINWIPIQFVSCSPVFGQILSYEVFEYPSSRWVTHQSFSRSDQLTRLAEHPASESLSSVWVDLIN